MTKANVNTAGRDELVDVGVRAEIADEILKLRRRAKITSLEALDELPGVGPATLEQLRKVLDFSDSAGNGGGNGDERPQKGERGATEADREVGVAAGSAVPGGAETARSAVRAGGEATASATRGGLEVMKRTVGAIGEVEREVTHRSVEGTAELSQALVDLFNEQGRHNLETLAALTRTVRWDEVIEAQGEFLRASLERIAGLTRRQLEVAQAIITSASSAAQDRGREAA